MLLFVDTKMAQNLKLLIVKGIDFLYDWFIMLFHVYQNFEYDDIMMRNILG